MGRLRVMRIVAALALLAFAGAGCAARWAHRQGQEAAEKGDWDLAVARLTRALDKDPRNIGYKIALENTRIQASRYHFDQARKHLAANDLLKAANELEIASKYDPANRSASDDLAIVRQRIEKQQEEQREREQFDQVKARGEAAARQPVPVLSASSNVRIPMARFESESLQKILESLGKLANVNVLFDEAFRDKKTSIQLKGLTFQELLDRVTLVNKLFYKVLDENTILIVPESRQNRIRYDEILLRTFYLQNAEVDETSNLIKTVAKITTIAANKALGAITILGTLDQLAIAERIIAANDKARGEVLVEVQILEVNRLAVRNWGLNLSSYSASATLSPTGSEGELSNGLLNLRAHLLSSLNQGDWMVSIPSTIFAQFLQTEDTARILAAPRLRAAEGKKTDLEIGTEVPIPVTSIGVGLGNQGGTGGLGGYYPSTSFQYKNVGVTMSLEPRVAASGDITLQVTAVFSILGGDRNVGTDANPLQVPTFLSRKVTATLRLRDGETGLIGGLLQGSESSNFAGSMGMNQIPILGKLFGSRGKKKEDSEILMSITPRIVRAPKLIEEDFIPLRVGTQEVPRVESARRRPFGTDAAPAAGGSEKAGQTAPPRGAVPRSAPGSAVPANAPASGEPALAPAEQAAPPEVPSAAAVVSAERPASAPASGSVLSPAAGVEGITGQVGPLAPPTSTPTSVPAAAAPPAGAAATPPASRPAAVPPPASPTTVLLSPPEVSVRVGQSAGLSVVLVGAKDVLWVEMTLVYDPLLVELSDLAAGALLTLDGSPVQAERTTEPGRARVRFVRTSALAGSGAVVGITIKGLKPGSGALAVESLRVGHAGAPEAPSLPAAGRVVVAP